MTEVKGDRIILLIKFKNGVHMGYAYCDRIMLVYLSTY